MVSTLGAIGLAFLAWNLGRFIGSSEGGIRKRTPIFILLLIISAAGVFNWMMVNFEGRKILQDAVNSAEQRYIKLANSAKKNVDDPKLTAIEAFVQKKEKDFISEVRNPFSCGFGPVAKQRWNELLVLLPDLKRYAGQVTRTTENCSSLAELYEKKIDDEWSSTNDSKKLENIRRDASVIQTNSDLYQKELANLVTEADANGSDFIVNTARQDLEAVNAAYKKNLLTLNSYAPDHGLPDSLDITTISNLGQWSQIVSVITSRLDQTSTYFYLLLSVFMDWMLVYFFMQYRDLRAKQPNRPYVSETSVPHL